MSSTTKEFNYLRVKVATLCHGCHSTLRHHQIFVYQIKLLNYTKITFEYQLAIAERITNLGKPFSGRSNNGKKNTYDTLNYLLTNARCITRPQKIKSLFNGTATSPASAAKFNNASPEYRKCIAENETTKASRNWTFNTVSRNRGFS